MSDYMIDIGKRAKEAEKILAKAGSDVKNLALKYASEELDKNRAEILSENKKDVISAGENGLNPAMTERLTLSDKRIDSMIKGLLDCAQLDDPVEKVLSGTQRPNGLKIEKITIPLGVIGVIFESRPNVASDSAALCLKSGNACILRGGKEAAGSNKIITSLLRKGIKRAGLPEDCVIFVDKTGHETANEMMKMTDYIDVLIPRGGHGLITAVAQNSTVPVIKTGEGNCHIYVDKDADINKAVKIISNAKTQRVSVCNACESLVIHKDIIKKALPEIKKELDKSNVIMYCDEEARKVCPDTMEATEKDFGEEYLDYKISVKTADSIDEAINHIEKYSTSHSEAIITENYEAAEKFADEITSAVVYINASTRFTDGGQFGFGAEIGISTQKLHARGPVGLPELVSYKYVIRGNGQVRI